MLYYAATSAVGSVRGCLLVDVTLRPLGEKGLEKHLAANRLKRVQAKIRDNGGRALAIASLVLGLFWVFWIGSVLGLVFGLIALGQIKRNNQKGRPLAITGIVLGGIGVVILLLAILAAAVGGGSPATVSPG